MALLSRAMSRMDLSSNMNSPHASSPRPVAFLKYSLIRLSTGGSANLSIPRNLRYVAEFTISSRLVFLLLLPVSSLFSFSNVSAAGVLAPISGHSFSRSEWNHSASSSNPGAVRMDSIRSSISSSSRLFSPLAFESGVALSASSSMISTLIDFRGCPGALNQFLIRSSPSTCFMETPQYRKSPLSSSPALVFAGFDERKSSSWMYCLLFAPIFTISSAMRFLV